MPSREHKTSTDLHWDTRPTSVEDHRKVNIADLAQRRLENEFLFAHLASTDRVLEIGCGNGFLTQDLRTRVAFVDSIDFSENMIASAKARYGESNNRFVVDSVFAGTQIRPPYDKVVCVRVLINLANLEEQKAAVASMARWVTPGGSLLMIEGFREGFEALDRLRGECGLPEIKPAAINFYSQLADLMPEMERHFDLTGEWHSGTFDVLTRVAKPLLLGAENVDRMPEFGEKIVSLALALNPDVLKRFARMRGFVLRRC